MSGVSTVLVSAAAAMAINVSAAHPQSDTSGAGSSWLTPPDTSAKSTANAMQSAIAQITASGSTNPVMLQIALASVGSPYAFSTVQGLEQLKSQTTDPQVLAAIAAQEKTVNQNIAQMQSLNATVAADTAKATATYQAEISTSAGYDAAWASGLPLTTQARAVQTVAEQTMATAATNLDSGAAMAKLETIAASNDPNAADDIALALQSVPVPATPNGNDGAAQMAAEIKTLHAAMTQLSAVDPKAPGAAALASAITGLETQQLESQIASAGSPADIAKKIAAMQADKSVNQAELAAAIQFEEASSPAVLAIELTQTAQSAVAKGDDPEKAVDAVIANSGASPVIVADAVQDETFRTQFPNIYSNIVNSTNIAQASSSGVNSTGASASSSTGSSSSGGSFSAGGGSGGGGGGGGGYVLSK